MNWTNNTPLPNLLPSATGDVAMAQEVRTAMAAAAATSAARNVDINVKIHRFDQLSPFPVNAFVVEDADGLVAIDATLTESASKAFRARIDEFAKPLRAVL